MSEQLNKDYVSNDGAFYLLGIMTGFALVKYAYSSRCGTRSLEETLDPEEAEAWRQQKAAREKMFQLLEETIQPFRGTKSSIRDGDVEEGLGSCKEGSFDSDDTSSKILTFSNACAICLEEFEDGVNVVRSVVAKSDCPHVFHEACLKEVISAATRKGNFRIPCPCCRQTFVETDPPREQNEDTQA